MLEALKFVEGVTCCFPETYLAPLPATRYRFRLFRKEIRFGLIWVHSVTQASSFGICQRIIAVWDTPSQATNLWSCQNVPFVEYTSQSTSKPCCPCMVTNEQQMPTHSSFTQHTWQTRVGVVILLQGLARVEHFSKHAKQKFETIKQVKISVYLSIENIPKFYPVTAIFPTLKQVKYKVTKRLNLKLIAPGGRKKTSGSAKLQMGKQLITGQGSRLKLNSNTLYPNGKRKDKSMNSTWQ